MPKRPDIIPILPPDPLEDLPGGKGKRNMSMFKPPADPKPEAKAADSNFLISNLPRLAAGLGAVLVICIGALFWVLTTYMDDVRMARRDAQTLETIRDEHAQMLYERYGIVYGSPPEVYVHGPFQSPFHAQMLSINPNFVCWITVDGTNINYPVVRGPDNQQYLYMSFFGEPTQFGVPFMDYRNVGGFVPHVIIYGHNTRHGNLFTELHLFLDEDFFEENRRISLLVNGRLVEYEIFSARLTDVNDPAYFLNFTYPGAFEGFLERIGAPSDAAQILTLSTCVRGPRDDDRLVVQAVLRG